MAKVARDTATKRTVTLRIKVPANVRVVTEITREAGPLDLNLPAGASNARADMQMDLTSKKTAAWLRKKTIASSDCSNCCCVRG